MLLDVFTTSKDSADFVLTAMPISIQYIVCLLTPVLFLFFFKIVLTDKTHLFRFFKQQLQFLHK